MWRDYAIILVPRCKRAIFKFNLTIICCVYYLEYFMILVNPTNWPQLFKITRYDIVETVQLRLTAASLYANIYFYSWQYYKPIVANTREYVAVYSEIYRENFRARVLMPDSDNTNTVKCNSIDFGKIDMILPKHVFA